MATHPTYPALLPFHGEGLGAGLCFDNNRHDKNYLLCFIDYGRVRLDRT